MTADAASEEGFAVKGANYEVINWVEAHSAFMSYLARKGLNGACEADVQEITFSQSVCFNSKMTLPT